MNDFKIKKEKLLSYLDLEIKNNPENNILKLLQKNLKSYNSVLDLNGYLSRTVVDCLDFELKIGEKLIEFEHYFSDLSNSIKSKELKKLAKYLMKNNKKITYFGKAWSEIDSNWIYFDTIMDLKKIRQKMSFSENIIEHQNLDNKSGLEKGFIDKLTNEGVMGKIK